MFLTTLNNVGSKTLFKPVFIRPEQVVGFLAVFTIMYFIEGKQSESTRSCVKLIMSSVTADSPSRLIRLQD